MNLTTNTIEDWERGCIFYFFFYLKITTPRFLGCYAGIEFSILPLNPYRSIISGKKK